MQKTNLKLAPYFDDFDSTKKAVDYCIIETETAINVNENFYVAFEDYISK